MARIYTVQLNQGTGVQEEAGSGNRQEVKMGHCVIDVDWHSEKYLKNARPRDMQICRVCTGVINKQSNYIMNTIFYRLNHSENAYCPLLLLSNIHSMWTHTGIYYTVYTPD